MTKVQKEIFDCADPKFYTKKKYCAKLTPNKRI